MNLYSIMGVVAGASLIMVAIFLRNPSRDTTGNAAVFLAAGFMLTVPSLLMLVAGQTANPAANKVFADPSFLFGGLLLGASAYLFARRREDISLELPSGPRAATVLISMVGLYTLFFGIAIARFQVIRPAPPFEPVLGRFAEAIPWLDGALWAAGYILVGLAALSAPWWGDPRVRRVVCWVFSIVGLYLALRSAFGGGYAQTGMIVNLDRGTNYLW